MTAKPHRNKVFISYSHQDVKIFDQLQKHLSVYKRKGLLDVWEDTKIKPGDDWRNAIEQAISQARVAILLVSADFLDSEFIATEELPPLLENAEKDGVRILPVIIRPCVFRDTELARFQAINNPNKPLMTLNRTRRDTEWVKIVEEVNKAVRASQDASLPTTKQESAISANIDKEFKGANIWWMAADLWQYTMPQIRSGTVYDILHGIRCIFHHACEANMSSYLISAIDNLQDEIANLGKPMNTSLEADEQAHFSEKLKTIANLANEELQNRQPTFRKPPKHGTPLQ